MEKVIMKPQLEKPITGNEKAEKTPQKFTLEKLRENSATLFGVSESTFIGATHGLKGEFTISEINNVISNWKKKEAI